MHAGIYFINDYVILLLFKKQTLKLFQTPSLPLTIPKVSKHPLAPTMYCSMLGTKETEG